MVKKVNNPSKKAPPPGNKIPREAVTRKKPKGEIKTGPGHVYVIIVPVVLILVNFLTYRHGIKNGFTNWDDPTYVMENKHIRELSPESINYFFVHPSASNYHPLTMISLAIDYYFTEKNDKGNGDTPDLSGTVFHRTNIILHLLN